MGHWVDGLFIYQRNQLEVLNICFGEEGNTEEKRSVTFGDTLNIIGTQYTFLPHVFRLSILRQCTSLRKNECAAL